MADFVKFVVEESTQAKMDHDFYLGNDKNRSDIEGTTIPFDEMQTFERGKSYNRSVTRRFLYEYYVKRVSWSRHDPDFRDDSGRFWFLGKGVKDYIIASDKKEFKFEEIQEIIESMAILCYTNDLMNILIEDWLNFMDTYLCDNEGA